MAARRSLRPAVGNIVHNPVLVVVAASIAVFQLPQVVFQSSEPWITTVVSGVVSLLGLAVIPFIHAGLLAMATEGLDGTTGLRTLREAGRSNYVPMLLATVGFVGVVLVYIFGVFFGLTTVGIFALFAVAAASGGLSTAFFVVLGLGAVLALVGYLAIILSLHFFGHAIVLDDASVGIGYWFDLPDFGLPAFLVAVVCTSPSRRSRPPSGRPTRWRSTATAGTRRRSATDRVALPVGVA